MIGNVVGAYGDTPLLDKVNLIRIKLEMITKNLILTDVLTFAARLIEPWLNGSLVS